MGFGLILGLTTGGLDCFRALGTVLISGFSGACLGSDFSFLLSFFSSCILYPAVSTANTPAEVHFGNARMKNSNALKIKDLSIV